MPTDPATGAAADRPPIARYGLGTAAVGRPGYITLGRDGDLPAERTVEALRDRTHALLDAAYAAGVRYLDTARSYGRAEEFVAQWLAEHPEAAAEVTVGSKWGYTYTAGWQTTGVAAHEVKEHSTAVFDRQIHETRALLGPHLDVYLVHSVTPDSPALTDTALHARLADLAGQGVRVGLSTSGPAQADTIRAALAVTADGRPLFTAVQATWNLLEPSAAPALAEAHAAGWLVVVKEGMANGRLAGRNATGDDTAALRALATRTGAPLDALALAAAAAQPWADLVLSGAATLDQLASNLTAATLHPTPDDLAALATLAEPAPAYWRTRAALPWA
ncbi:aldo/keto reductase [Kitasatospora sp. NBC_01300]|uniref:aldo/keto reductase n=1 Tax=Kitasatospora sp. NBC_01300 TaxID=2903574 RepID=UPI00352DC591|nr:aldo/keto reductase [Kitasatospora sp. NBC_01300]WSK08365.1 aldo/keto reductase [Kitasatospora sp. NBC_01300]